MTQKANLKKAFKKLIETKWMEDNGVLVVLERLLDDKNTDMVFDFFWNEIKKVRKEDRDMIETVIKDKREWYSGFGNQPIRTVLNDLLVIIKMRYERKAKKRRKETL